MPGPDIAPQAVILAGGAGTRLHPLTLTRAKPVVPLSNRPFLAYQLAHLRAHGIEDVVLACGYRVDDVRAALGDGSALGVRLRYVVESTPLGTGGGLRHATDQTSGTILVLNGDVLTDVDVTALVAFHRARQSRTTIYLTPVEDPRAFGLVETDDTGRLLRFREKPGADEALPTNMINAGIYLLDATLLQRIPPGRVVSIERDIFPALIAEGVPGFGWHAPSYWRDIGNPRAYLAAQIDLLEDRVRTPLTPPGRARNGTWMGQGLEREPDAAVAAPSVIGSGVWLGAASRVGPRVALGDGGRVGPGAQIEAALLWERVLVGAGARLAGCVVGADAVIGPEADLGEGVVVAPGAQVPAGARLRMLD